MKTPLLIILLTLVPPLLGGCSVINVYGNGVEVKRYFGLPLYSIDPKGSAIYFDLTGVGVVAGPSGATLGYVNQAYAAIPPNTCTSVFFTEDSKAAEDLIKYLIELDIDPGKICTINNRGKQ
ncbi:hypothetical protein LF844_12460 [Metapseudomonas lalkuanensis]|uniref:hypothetical protein n=1 Tax=Metapseudomonas lalkuanensis TaxID=2604832 RepID=UPI001CF255F6|nr:hypothetical protein [Pseudomonas lalkuanensis]UCP00581.1 hypothetical protein LF844_12460 [Pseudomonas lalkuanensis]